MENTNRNNAPTTKDDRVAGWAQGEYIRALRPKIEELDRACAQVRQILFDLRKLLRQ